jgi:hypothetical protein
VARRDPIAEKLRLKAYSTAHKRLRRLWKIRVAGGNVPCARCGRPILRGQAWHLDHTDDRGGYLGPSHAKCNLSAAGHKAAQKRPDTLRPQHSRRW